MSVDLPTDRTVTGNTGTRGFHREYASSPAGDEGADPLRTVGRVRDRGTPGKLHHRRPSRLQLSDPGLDLGQVLADQGGGVFARRLAGTPDRQYLADLGQSQPGGLGVTVNASRSTVCVG